MRDKIKHDLCYRKQGDKYKLAFIVHKGKYLLETFQIGQKFVTKEEIYEIINEMIDDIHNFSTSNILRHDWSLFKERDAFHEEHLLSRKRIALAIEEAFVEEYNSTKEMEYISNGCYEVLFALIDRLEDGYRSASISVAGMAKDIPDIERYRKRLIKYFENWRIETANNFDDKILMLEI